MNELIIDVKIVGKCIDFSVRPNSEAPELYGAGYLNTPNGRRELIANLAQKMALLLEGEYEVDEFGYVVGWD